MCASQRQLAVTNHSRFAIVKMVLLIILRKNRYFGLSRVLDQLVCTLAKPRRVRERASEHAGEGGVAITTRKVLLIVDSRLRLRSAVGSGAAGEPRSECLLRMVVQAYLAILLCQGGGGDEQADTQPLALGGYKGLSRFGCGGQWQTLSVVMDLKAGLCRVPADIEVAALLYR